MSEAEIEKKIHEHAPEIAKLIAKDTDCELRRDHKKGVKILKCNKKEICI